MGETRYYKGTFAYFFFDNGTNEGATTHNPHKDEEGRLHNVLPPYKYQVAGLRYNPHDGHLVLLRPELNADGLVYAAEIFGLDEALDTEIPATAQGVHPTFDALKSADFHIRVKNDPASGPSPGGDYFVSSEDS